MYLNHFDHFGQMTKTLLSEIGNNPIQWESATFPEAMPPIWEKNVAQDCSVLLEEILVLSNETKAVRKMVRFQKRPPSAKSQKLLIDFKLSPDPRTTQPAWLTSDDSSHNSRFDLCANELCSRMFDLYST